MKAAALALLLSGFTFSLHAQTQAESASYADRPEVQGFIQEVSARNGIDAEELRTSLRLANYEPEVLRLIQPPARVGVRSWTRYRGRFVEPVRIRGGLEFWEEHAEALRRASATYQVPPEIIVAIIGVETVYGRHTGNFQTLSALATLAFDYPPRADLFRRELEALLLLGHEQGRPAWSYYGSYAGALGDCQFLPSSIRSYAVDFDHDGQIDLEASADDAIGSVANYLHQHGWQADGPIAVRARVDANAAPNALVDAGIEPSLSLATLGQLGIHAQGAAQEAPVTLVDLATPGRATEYWLGYQNFYVITRYNKSSFYAMAVFQLAQALREARG